jgi:T5SS/PEP-CTERM-associated repeat protein
MVQTTFTVAAEADLTTALQDISIGGTDATTGTAYTITATAGILATSETVTLPAASSLTLQGGFPFIVNAFTMTGSVIADLNYTGTITLDGGNFVNVSTSVTNGTIVAGLFTGAIFGVASDGGDTVINNGTITGGPVYAINLSSGSIQNGWNGQQSALISGALGGVALLDSGLVQNGGTIATTGTTSATVFLGSGTVDNGQLGDTLATISGGFNGVEIAGAGTVNNDGTITNMFSDAVYLGAGLVTNGQIGDNTAWIDAGAGGNGVSINQGVGTVVNYGTITGGSASGAYLGLGGTVTNGSVLDPTALISGALTGVLLTGVGALINYGTVSATDSASPFVAGASLVAGSMILNSGIAATIVGDDWGASTHDGSALVINGGTIEATSASGLGLDLNAGGTVINGTGPGSEATISGAYDGVRISAGAAGAGASVVNDGTIEGATGVDFQSGPTAATGTLTNDGLVESMTGPGGNAVVFGTGTERLVLQSAGAFIGEVVGGSAGNSTTMELASGTNGALSSLATDSGTVSDNTGSFGFSSFETIAVDSGATWIIDAPGTLDTVSNAGALSLSGGSVSVTGSISNSGSLTITGNTLVATAGALLDTGIIAVSADGTLQADGSGVTVSGILGTTGVLTVAGLGSKLLAPGELSVGLGGDGSLLIENLATAITGGNSADASAGFDIGQNGIAPGGGTVPGSGSATVSNALLSNTGQFIVGDAGTGSLSITEGGTVTTSGNATIANQTGSDGSAMSVSGPGSSLTVTGALDVGNAAAGALSINAGATVTAASLDAGVQATDTTEATGQISLSGTSTLLNITGNAIVGDEGSANLSVINGATFAAANLTIGAQGPGSGAVFLTDAGTLLDITGTLNIGTAIGVGELTIGPNATVIATKVVLQGEVVNEGGDLDPNEIDITPGNPLVGSGGAGGVGDIIVNDGSIEAKAGKLTKTETVTGSIVGTFGSLSGTGNLVIDASSTLSLQGGPVDASQTVLFAAGSGALVVGDIGGFGAVIGQIGTGDTIIVQTVGPATFSTDGSVVSVIENGTTLGTLDFATPALASAGTLVDQSLCFLPDTLIATPAGEVKVQALKVGDVVCTASGAERPIAWIGQGRVLAPRGRRSAATPVIVRRGALGPNVPHYDLHVTKGHALFIDDVLIPVEFLVNHRSILWDDQAHEVVLYHVELDSHDVLLANGAAAESYRDDGNRWLFQNANSGWEQPAKPPCALVLTGGPVVDAVWQRLLEWSGPRPGLPLTDDADLHLLADGVRVDGARSGDRCVFQLRSVPAETRLMSRAASPAELGLARDPRVLGVAVRRLELWQGPKVRLLEADDERLVDGFHGYEAACGHRWTDGDALLPAAVLEDFTGAVELVMHFGGATQYAECGETTTLQSVA